MDDDGLDLEDFIVGDDPERKGGSLWTAFALSSHPLLAVVRHREIGDLFRGPYTPP